MENPINPWMIWGEHPLFSQKHPLYYSQSCSDLVHKNHSFFSSKGVDQKTWGKQHVQYLWVFPQGCLPFFPVSWHSWLPLKQPQKLRKMLSKQLFFDDFLKKKSQTCSLKWFPNPIVESRNRQKMAVYPALQHDITCGIFGPSAVVAANKMAWNQIQDAIAVNVTCTSVLNLGSEKNSWNCVIWIQLSW